MRFVEYGVEHDTDRMQAFATGDPDEPTIYMDGECRVFIERVRKGGDSVLRRALTHEIMLLAALYRIRELTQALRGQATDRQKRIEAHDSLNRREIV